MAKPRDQSTPAATILNPRHDFASGKVLVWALIGPLNPISWTLIALFWEPFQIFGLVAFLTLWPCTLIGAIALLRLKRSTISRDDLFGFVLGWAAFAIPLYTFLLCLAANIWWGLPGNAAADIGFFAQVSMTFVYWTFLLPFAIAVGAIPAFGAATMSYWAMRYIMFAGD